MAGQTSAERSAAVDDQPRDGWGRWTASAGAASAAIGDAISSADSAKSWKNPAARMKLSALKGKYDTISRLKAPPLDSKGFFKDSFMSEYHSAWDMRSAFDDAEKDIDDGTRLFGANDEAKVAAAKAFKKAKQRYATAYSTYTDPSISPD